MLLMALEDPVGSQYRTRHEEARKRDRLGAICYGPVVRQRRDGWSAVERWMLDHDLYVGDIVDATGDSLADVASARPGIVRLAALALGEVPGAVIVERHRKLVDSLTQAVVARYMQDRDRRLVVSVPGRMRYIEVTPVMTERWVREAGKSHVGECVAALFEAAKWHWAESSDSVELVVRFGSGPRRDVDLARVEARRRLDAGWSQRQTREYLELCGFTNSSETVGRWSHDEFSRLLADSR